MHGLTMTIRPPGWKDAFAAAMEVFARDGWDVPRSVYDALDPANPHPESRP